jgi:glucokinase
MMMTRPAPFMFPLIVADVGGTNARFAFLASADAPLSAVVTVPTAHSPDFAETVMEAVRLGGWERPRSLILAVAGAINGQESELNNSQTSQGRLRIAAREMKQRLRLTDGLLLNDFEALAMALPELCEADCKVLRDRPKRPGHMLVVGSGTGLGVGTLLQTPQGWFVIGSQGGHLQLPVRSVLLGDVLNASGIPHWTGDEILSGRGLLGLYRGCVAVAGKKVEIGRPADISGLLASGDVLARQAVDMFAELLTGFAASLTLVALPEGGTFIGGGLAPRFASHFTPDLAEKMFRPGGEGAVVLDQFRLSLITAENPAFLGLAALARRPADYPLDHKARRWRVA